jgi:hypothetical protein
VIQITVCDNVNIYVVYNVNIYVYVLRCGHYPLNVNA